MAKKMICRLKTVSSNKRMFSHRKNEERLSEMSLSRQRFLKKNPKNWSKVLRFLPIPCHYRQSQPSVTHYFDHWHIVKGLVKKLLAASKQNGCELIAEWIKALKKSLLYWC
ncbi:uncharacterized protein LOC144637254 [Oculina patagonica]